MNIASPASQKQHGDASVPKVDAHSATKRLQSELMKLMVCFMLCVIMCFKLTRSRKMSSVPGVTAFPEGDNLLSWVGTIQGATGTVHKARFEETSFFFPLTFHRFMKGYLINYHSNFLLDIHMYPQ